MKWTSFEDLVTNIGAAIRARRESMELSQEHVSHEAGLTVRHYAKLEKGGTNPTIETLFNVAAALDLDVLELIQLAARRRKAPVRKK